MFALITGASSGIGREFARLLAKKNYDLIIAARRGNRLNKLKEEIQRKYPVKVVIKQCDLSVPENCVKLYEETKRYPIKILINNAGFGKIGNFEDISLETERSMIQTNITALHILTKLFVKGRKKGYLLNVASAAGFQPGPIMSTYAATKAYVVNFSLGVNYELKKGNKKIHITTLCPGPVDTEFNKVADAEFSLKSISSRQCAIEALRGLFLKKDIVIPGCEMKVLAFASKVMPLNIVLPMEYLIQKKKKIKS